MVEQLGIVLLHGCFEYTNTEDLFMQAGNGEATRGHGEEIERKGVRKL